MRYIIYILFIIFLIISNSGFSQKTGFASLNFVKTSLESIVKQYGASIPDSSKVAKEFYLPISKQYNSAKASYEAYKGAMKDCILNNNTEKKIKKCLQNQTISVENNLDTLQGLLDNAYIQYYITHPSNLPITNTTNDTGIITADFIKTVVGELIDAGIKIWDEIQKRNKQFKDDYLSNLQSKDYTLSDFDDLVKQGSSKK